jgi:hypothetical protein
MAESKSNRIVVKQMARNTYRDLLRFVYSCTMPRTFERLCALYAVADALLFPSLRRCCVLAMCERITTANACDVYAMLYKVMCTLVPIDEDVDDDDDSDDDDVVCLVSESALEAMSIDAAGDDEDAAVSFVRPVLLASMRCEQFIKQKFAAVLASPRFLQMQPPALLKAGISSVTISRQ